MSSVRSETLNLDTLHIDAPMTTWFVEHTIQGSPRLHHDPDCRYLKHVGAVAALQFPADEQVSSQCSQCRRASLGDFRTREAQSIAAAARLLAVAKNLPATGAFAEVLTQSYAVQARWPRPTFAARTRAQTGQPGVQIPTEDGLRARRHVPTIIAHVRSQILRARDTLIDDGRRNDHDLRYFAITSLTNGAVDEFRRESVPQNKLTESASRYAWDAAAAAFSDLCDAVQAGEPLTEAAATAARELVSAGAFDETEAAQLTADWVRRAEAAFDQAQEAGNVRFRIGPTAIAGGILGKANAALVTYLDAFEPDGSITMTAPAALAGQFFAADRSYTRARVTLLPGGDYTGSVFATLNRFYVTSNDPFLEVAVTSRLITA